MKTFTILAGLVFCLSLTGPVVCQAVELSDGQVYFHLLEQSFMYHQTSDHWAVVGIRPFEPLGDYDLYLYDDQDHTTLLASSLLPLNSVDFVVGDYNHIPVPQWDYPDVQRWSLPTGYHIEWEDGSEALTMGNYGPFDWAVNHVVCMWDVSLTAGHTYTFNLNVSSMAANLGFALFKSNNAPYYAGRVQAQVEADDNGAGQSESFTYDAPSTDVYGLVVWDDLPATGGIYYINITDQTPVPALEVTLTPINPPIVIPANGGSFNFNASVKRNQAPPAPYYAWTRNRYPNGTYSGILLGPVLINSPVGVTVTRQRTQVVPASWSAGGHWFIGYVHTSVSYPATDADSFPWTKLASNDGGPVVWEAANYGEEFPSLVGGSATPQSSTLIGASPNPFNPTTTLRYSLPEGARVAMTVYDLNGRRVATLAEGPKSAGNYEVVFDGSRLPSGIYFCRLETGNYHHVVKMVLAK